jgi:hypothetical protein
MKSNNPRAGWGVCVDWDAWQRSTRHRWHLLPVSKIVALKLTGGLEIMNRF